MKSMSIYRRGLFIVLALVMALVALGPLPAAQAAIGPALDPGPRPVVLPPNAKPYGHTYSEWGNMWWQWAYSIPAAQNPLRDETGVNCGVAQSGQVFYLTGVFNVSGTAVRDDCYVPVGKALLIPILNYEASTAEGNGTTVDELRAFVNDNYEALVDESSLQLDIDGVHLGGEVLKYYRTSRWQTPEGFNFTLPENNILGLDPGTSLSVAGGYYAMVAPLPKGNHQVHIHGEIPFYNFTLDVTYSPLHVR